MTMPNGFTTPPVAQSVTLNFSSPVAMATFLMLDRAVADLHACASHLQLIGQVAEASTLTMRKNEIMAQRDAFLRRDQGGIVLAGPGALG